ncbi:MAG: exodeoxyribonuclease V subunit gamma [Acidimicrobiia bacterium]|nr:exodeoxyribonuclease V subunit gamma [Acidimicrobiia bacterium]
MVQFTASSRLDQLANALASRLATPMADPFTPEWVVVVNAGVGRWLRLRLARSLGASDPTTATDGVAANIEVLYPGGLTRRLLTPDLDADDDPWSLDRLPWAVLDVLCAPSVADELAPLGTLPPGGTWWGRARRLADLLDRYHLHRPAMVRAWAEGHDVDGNGIDLPAGDRWQPALWRAVRARIDAPSPAELAPERLAAVRNGGCPDVVPERVSIFGLSAIPGGASFLGLLDALATQRQVDVFLHRPSPAMAAHLRNELGSVPSPLPRADDHSAELVRHPLLRSWARPARDAELLLADHPLPDVDPAHDETTDTGATLLARLQADLRADRAPTGDLRVPDDDRSIRFHSCHGTTRQVEVLRDEILHLLASDDSLTEDDVVVLCPAIEEFAPHIEAVFGPSAPAGTAAGRSPHTEPPTEGCPALAYRLVDRSLSDVSPLFRALSALLDLLGSRLAASTLADFVALQPVREQFGFDDAALATIDDWLEASGVRWGLDGDHRRAWDIPETYTDGTWQAALDRLLVGITTSDGPELPLATGGLLPLGVEGSDVALAGRFADLLARLRRLVADTQVPHDAAGWSALLADATSQLFATDAATRWSTNRLQAALADLARHAEVAGAPVAVPLTLADVRRLVVDVADPGGGRASLFRGGVTVASLAPLRAVPHRVVCLLGMDDQAFGAGRLDGDDLVAASPVVGDRDRRADVRQALLESVLAAGDHLVVIRTGHSVVTNQPVPPSVPVAELRDTVAGTLHPDVRADVLARIDLVHPRQPFDERNFCTDPDDPLTAAGPWSFDPVACDGARARVAERQPHRPLVAGALPARPDGDEVIDLADIHDFLANPVRHFLRRRLGLTVPQLPDRGNGRRVQATTSGGGGPTPVEYPDLRLELDALESWKVKDRLLTHLRAGYSPESFVLRERARGCLPAGRLADAVLSSALEAMEPVVGAVDELGVPRQLESYVLVDLVLGDGTRVVGSVADAGGATPGPVRITCSEPAPKRRLPPWLDLLALTAHQPETVWWSVGVTTRKRKKNPADIEIMEIPSDDPAQRRRQATDALAVVVDLYRRGRCEPVPLFTTLSPAIVADTPLAKCWRDFDGRGDAGDRWVGMVYGELELREILALPVRPDDPEFDDRGKGRTGRYAAALWDTLGSTLVGDDANAETTS